MRNKLTRNYLANLVVFLILISCIWLRTSAYGDLRLSIGNIETISYIDSSRAPLLSWEIFAGRRLFTTNIIFKAANDTKNCPSIVPSLPAIGLETVRTNQRCFDNIALLQNILAILGWSFLAWVTARRMQNPFIKIIAASTIMFFGFTPQVAEWDSVLSPESLSLSLFAITLGLAQEIAFHKSISEGLLNSRAEKLLLVSWSIVFLVWVFVRDVHLYAIPLTLFLITPLFFLKQNVNLKLLTVTAFVLITFLLIGFFSARDSLRATRYPLINALDAYIWPYPKRIEFFKNFGMPERISAQYQEWADINATKAYGLFLISHPGFVASTLWEYKDQLTSDFIQPYFTISDIKNRDTLLAIGEMFHPQSLSVYVIDLLLLFALVVNAGQFRTPSLLAWAWLAIWFFAIAAVTLILSFFGDISGTRRHIMPSVEMFRLFLWIFIMPFLDLPIKQLKQPE